MSRARSLIASACLAILIGACNSGTGGGSGGTVDNGGTTGNPSGGTASNGGTTGTPSGGTVDNGGTVSNGGTTSNPNGGTVGNGGTTSNPNGGTTSNPNGGTTGTPNGGTTSNPNGGTTSNPNGGTTSNPNGGTTSNPNGGTTANPGSGGSRGGSSGGSAGATVAGGSQAGGSQSSGGSTGAAGATTASTALVTSATGAYWKTTGTWAEAASATADVTVNDTSTAQTWEGFGGAFNEKGWSYLTTKAMQDQAMQLLFGNDGCRFAWGRIPIGASDYAMDRYTDDEVSSGTDTSMSSFSITRDQQKLIPYIKAAQAVKPDIRFWASPWTPPTWMKATPYLTPGNPVNAFDGGTMKSDDATLKAYAQYLVKWIQAFNDQGIKAEFVSQQNEPNYQQNYPSCHWDTANFVKFVGSYLGPALTAASLTTKVMDGTLSNTSGDSDIGQSVLKDSAAKGYIGVIGVQWGMAAANQVTTLKGLAGGIPIWLSEHQCGGTMGSTAPAPNDQAYGVASWGYIRDAIKNGLTAYNAWNMVLDKGGLGIDNTRKWPQNALLVADSGNVTGTPAYYVFRHFSQFVDPGAKVVGTSGGDAIAFKNPDGSIVAVMYNSGGAKSTFTVSMGGKKLQFSMPGAGWATVKNK